MSPRAGAPTLLAELEAALAVLRAAGREILRRYAALTPVADPPADLSTEADRASQELIVRRLHRAFPEDGFCAEEATALPGPPAAKADRFWVVDPIDGTRGFAGKNGEFSVLVALVEGGTPILGAVFEPVADRLTYATQGGGCRLREPFDAEPRRCSVTATEGRPRTLTMSRSRGPEGRRELLEAFGARETIETWSAGIKLAQVARGEADLYLGDYLTLHDWDVCAGHLLVEEAGGRITDVDGGTVAYDGSGASLRGRGLLATNGRLHAAALEALAAGKVRWR